MAHGFSGVRDQRLDAYAERFAAAGLACLVFDYRHFGDSGGQPRQLLDIGRQLDDWRAAIAFARSLEEVDGDRIGLWGTSFSGATRWPSRKRTSGCAPWCRRCPSPTVRAPCARRAWRRPSG